MIHILIFLQSFPTIVKPDILSRSFLPNMIGFEITICSQHPAIDPTIRILKPVGGHIFTNLRTHQTIDPQFTRIRVDRLIWLLCKPSPFQLLCPSPKLG